jgi:hypothetical protein
MKKYIVFFIIFIASCKQKQENNNFTSYSNSLPEAEDTRDSLEFVAIRIKEKFRDSIDNAFNDYSKKLKSKTGKEACEILEDIYYKIHLNNVTIKKKYNNNWSSDAYAELEILNKKTIKKSLSIYKLSSDDYYELTQKSIGICHTTY